MQEVLDDLTVFLGLVQILQLVIAVDLSVTGGVGFGLRSEVVPMLGDQPFLIKAEDVERNLFACAGEVVNGLQEDLVAILKSTDVVDSGLHGSRSKPCNTAYKGVTAGAVSEVVLDVALCKQRSSLLSVAGGEGVNEGESLFDFSHGRIPPKIYSM